MAKAYEPAELAKRIFYISMAGVGSFIAAVFLFIL
jgi:hypothetical protein